MSVNYQQIFEGLEFVEGFDTKVSNEILLELPLQKNMEIFFHIASI